MVNEETKPRMYIPPEKPIMAGPVRIDHKFIWAVVFFVITIIGLYITSQTGGPLASVLFLAGVVMLYLFLFSSGMAARGYRYGSHHGRSLLGRNRHLSVPTEGEAIGLSPAKFSRIKPIKLIGRVDFLPHQTVNGTLGVAFDHRYNTYSGLMWAASPSLLTADGRGQTDRLNAFAVLLDSMAEAGSLVHRFAWHEQTFISEPQRPEETVDQIRAGASLARQEPPNQAVLLKRLAEMGDEAVVHRTTMTVSIYGPDAKRQAKAVSKKGTAGYEAVLEQTLEAFYALAMGLEYGSSPIGLKAASFASYNDLVLENRLALDPIYAQPLLQGWARPEDDSHLLSEQVAWPGFVNFEPTDHCRLGETYHMGFFIQEFTRTGMAPGQIWHVLKLPIPKTVTVVFQMVPAARAQRYAEWSATGASGSNVDRAMSNRRVTGFQRRSAEEALRHEDEIAWNKGQVGRVRCYIDLTGASLEEVRDNASKLRYACADARFLLEPLLGRQHLGIQAVMPIGRGLSALTESWKWLS